jgi:hypothetical protein
MRQTLLLGGNINRAVDSQDMRIMWWEVEGGKKVKGYKAFSKGLICKNKQYAENTVFEEDKAIICERGMHFCENPLNVLDYYPLLDGNNELPDFAEVEALDEASTDYKKKYVTKKLRVGAKLDLKGFVKASVDFLMERGEEGTAASGFGSKLAASGDCSKLAASGDCSKLAASGFGSQLAASGFGSQLAASGDCSKLAASGDCSKLAASGNNSKLAINGKNSVGAAIGYGNQIKGVTGSWITLAEYTRDGFCVCVKSAQIDGKTLKADTWYVLKNGEIVQASNV